MKRGSEGGRKGGREKEKEGQKEEKKLKNIGVMALEVCSKTSGKEYTPYNFLLKKKETKRNKVNHIDEH